MTQLARPSLRRAHALLALVACMAAGAAQAQLTGVAGGGQPFSNLQGSLAVTQAVALSGIFPGRDPGTAFGDTLGFVYAFAGNFAPGRSAQAAGSLLPINTNTAVFSLMGTTYGGNGVTNFALPDLRGRAVVGDGNGPFLPGRLLGENFGSAQVALTPAQMPVHAHPVSGPVSTGLAGGFSAFDNAQPSLTMTRLIAVSANFPSRDGSNGAAFIGQVATFAGNFAPSGWAEANGQVLPIAQNAALFSVLGTSFGGDGIRTFALPDLRGRVSVGASDLLPVGGMTGNQDVTLTGQNLPAHSHSLNGGGSTGTAGLGLPVDNMQPSLALTPLIALEGIFPSTSGGGGFNTDLPLVGQIVEFAGSFAPGGWALANGQLLSIAEHETLFQVIGTTYGGDGTSTFALPDLRGRTMVGTGSSFELGRNLSAGEQLGSNAVALSVANLPPHLHTAPVPEPGSAALLLAGLAALGLARRRRLRV